MPLFNLIMLRRNFLKKIIFFTVGIISMSNKLLAKEVFSKEIFKDGIFYNNYIDHKMTTFKQFWKWRKESKKPEPMDEPIKLLKKLAPEKNLLSNEFVAMTHGESKIL